jgi:hypothetical protein
MKKLFFTLSFLISVMCISSQSWGLADCPSTGVKHNCYGISLLPNGGEYLGEWKDNTWEGQEE